MGRQRPISVRLAIVELVVALAAHGFVHRGTSRSGSRYAGRPGSPFRIRVSDHPPAHPERHPEVLRSIVVVEPMTKDEIEERCRDEAAEFDRRIALRLAGVPRRSNGERTSAGAAPVPLPDPRPAPSLTSSTSKLSSETSGI